MKFITISMIIIGIIVIFNAGGIETPAGGLVKQFMDGGLSTFKDSTFWTTFATILTVGIGGGVIAGLFGRAPPESYLVAGLVFSLGGVILTDGIAIYSILWNTSETFIRWIVSLIFIPMIIGFFMSMISFWRGVDG